MVIRSASSLALVALFVGCDRRSADDTATPPVESEPADVDGDGYTTLSDCDDDDARAHPLATEECDGIDNDCDGTVDEGVLYADADGDGYGDGAVPIEGTLCPDAGKVVDSTDCNDGDAEFYPGAPESCDGRDANCDGERSVCDLDAAAEWTLEEHDREHIDGVSASIGGDIDGDGLSDVLVGGGGGEYYEGFNDEREGQVHLVRASSLVPGMNYLGRADWTLTGDDGDRAAGGVYTIGGACFLPDLDEDGLSEILIGAPGYWRAWLVTGATLGEADSVEHLPNVADQLLRDPTFSRASIGKTVSVAGDMDGDGVLDLAIGAGAGVFFVPFAPELAEYHFFDGVFVEGDYVEFGDTIASAGDIDGDGLDDFLVGDPGYREDEDAAGAALVFLGGSQAWGTIVSSDLADLRVTGAAGSYLGTGVARAGDVDGDGGEDWWVTALGVSDEAGERVGAAYLMTGGLADDRADDAVAELRGASGGNLARVTAGDFNGDGRPDAAFVSSGLGENGVAFLVSNPDLISGDVLNETVTGRSLGSFEHDSSLAGAISMTGDVDGDGSAELLLTAYAWDPAGLSYFYGKAWIVRGE